MAVQQHHCSKLPCTLTGKGISDKTWTKAHSFDDKFGSLHKAKMDVFSDLVLCVGGAMSHACLQNR